ncbi:cytochrome P450 [Caballeronia sp. dw_276]|jgi:cytochrome P450|uniref:cytochrome P450 n=1 Tax=Caballeronia sp. dw_276 TaxID=2719795 RepID=UPI001BD212AB|nr:cytochrome P450 [Caballeronia sp. dw_276]
MKFSDLSSPAFFENPYPFYEQLRAEAALVPLAPNVVLTGRYAIIEALLHDRRMGKTYMQSVAARYGESGYEQPVFQALSRMFLMMNPPMHTRLRSLLMKAFNARQIDLLRDIAQSTADNLIDALKPKEEFDLVSDYLFPLPVNIICRLLDVPVEDGVRLGSAASHLGNALDSAPMDAERLAAANEATLTLQRYFAGVVEQRRLKPGNDLVSALVRAEEAGESLNDDEIISNVLLLFVAGHETTSNMLGNALIALHRQPGQLALLKRDPSLLTKAVSECLRFDSSVQMIVRTALEDVEVEGVSIARGTIVFMMVGSANRDPGQFSNPDQLDIERALQGKLLSFAAGIHHCLGARLATLELEIGLGTLVSRLPDLRITNLDALQWRQRNTLRGVESLKALYCVL